jgi:hypothetical protein
MSYMSFYFILLSHRFRSIKGGRLIRLVRRGMRTDQALFPLKIEPGISRARPWKDFIALIWHICHFCFIYKSMKIVFFNHIYMYEL